MPIAPCLNYEQSDGTQKGADRETNDQSKEITMPLSLVRHKGAQLNKNGAPASKKREKKHQTAPGSQAPHRMTIRRTVHDTEHYRASDREGKQ